MTASAFSSPKQSSRRDAVFHVHLFQFPWDTFYRPIGLPSFMWIHVGGLQEGAISSGGLAASPFPFA